MSIALCISVVIIKIKCERKFIKKIIIYASNVKKILMDVLNYIHFKNICRFIYRGLVKRINRSSNNYVTIMQQLCKYYVTIM